MLMTAKAYREKYTHPLLAKIKQALKTAMARYHALIGKLSGLQKAFNKADNAVYNLTERIRDEQLHSKRLETEVKVYRQIKKYLVYCPDKAQDLVQQSLASLEAHKRLMRKKENMKGKVQTMENKIVNSEIIYTISVRNEVVKSKYHIPKIFWKYYDSYRRNRIDLTEFSKLTELSTDRLLHLLSII